MNLLRVSWRNLWHKPFSTGVSVLLMLLGVSMVSLVLQLGHQLEGQFLKNIEGVDYVVGAKGSPKQLILSSIYHIDSPTGNIDEKDADFVLNNRMVKTAIPLAFGDSYKGFKILGTTKEYLTHYKTEFALGKPFEKNMQVVLGAKAALRLNLKVGDHFHGSHGMEEADDEHVHDEHAYTVVGVLAETGLAIDQLIICNIESVWQIHGHEHNANGAESSKEYTAILVQMSSMNYKFMFPRMVSDNTDMQAASPSVHISNLIDQMGIGIETLRLLALLIIIISGISVFLSLLAALKERKYELAIMRSLGAHPMQLVLLVFYESILIALLSSTLGLLLSRGLLVFLGNYLDSNYHYSFNSFGILNDEYWLVLLAIAIASASALVPSIMAFRINISKTLAED
ncbi:MAG: FtsX-like permease family protein [Bacteroidia bacterium]